VTFHLKNPNRNLSYLKPISWKQSYPKLRLQSQDGNLASSPLIPDRLWLIRRHDQAIWETQLTNEPRINSGAVQMVARNDPLWEPDTVVDVVVRVPISDQEFCLVRSPDQTIQRSE
jgi:hypothetical protein